MIRRIRLFWLSALYELRDPWTPDANRALLLEIAALTAGQRQKEGGG